MPDNATEQMTDNTPKPRIKYVCISDMHLGSKESILTCIDPDTGEPSNSDVLVNLVECLRNLIDSVNGKNAKKPTLILMGDILDMALSTTEISSACFEGFIELIMPQSSNKKSQMFKDIIYIPGNHDHVLWDMARNTQYVDYIANHPQNNLPRQWHTTCLFEEEGERAYVKAYFLQSLINRVSGRNGGYLKYFNIKIAYPNLGLKNTSKYVVVTHGHYVERIYHLMSILYRMIFPGRKEPKEIWEIEQENFNWINFFWSYIGDTGEIARGIELIYDKLQSKPQVYLLVANLLFSIALEIFPKFKFLEGFLKWVTVKFIKFLNKHVKGTERSITDECLTDETKKGLAEYIEGPLLKQIKSEICFNHPPKGFTFIFGHTHKPFSAEMSFDCKPNIYNIYNTGGWVVETTEVAPLHGGSVLLLDNDLSPAHIRMYNETKDDKGKCRITVETASPCLNKFAKSIETAVNDAASPWKDFLDSVAKTVKERRKKRKERVKAN
ncbi:MAG: metallophosphoesterase [Nitrospirae bacterium]|nr:metallophosphoesterase [Nitrospirota bacterium]